MSDDVFKLNPDRDDDSDDDPSPPAIGACVNDTSPPNPEPNGIAFPPAAVES